MIIKLFREDSQEEPFATKSILEAAFEKVAKAAGSENWWDVEQVVKDVEKMRKTLLIARTMFHHEDLAQALFLAQRVSDEEFEFSQSFKILVDKFNEGMQKILQGDLLP